MPKSGLTGNLFDISYRNKVPLLCTFELTQRCNLACRHCYLEQTAPRPELSTTQVKAILRQLDRAGTLYLSFTGGEVFLRPDIVELAAYARSLRFDLRLFTNATLLNKHIIRELAGLDLGGIEISLYGRELTHDSITRAPGSFQKTMDAILTLKKRRIRVTIKTPLMKMNYSDYPYLVSLSKQLNTSLKIDPTIAPRNNGDKSNLRYRLGTRRLRRVLSSTGFLPSALNTGNAVSLLCSAGHNLLSIGCDGIVYPCLQLQMPLGNLNKQRLSEIWRPRNIRLAKYRNIRTSQLQECSSCKQALYCQRCPGLAHLEDGSILGPSRAACTLAKITHSGLKQHQKLI